LPLPPAEELARLWGQGSGVDLAEFLARSGPLPPTQLAEVFHVDQHHRWERGERPAVESYLQRFPQVTADADAVVDVIFHDYLLRERSGEIPDAQEYAARFPAYADAVQTQITFHRLLSGGDMPRNKQASVESTATHPAWPRPPGTLAVEAPSGLIARGPSSTREVQSLLRSRLRLFATISAVAFLFYIPVLWTLFAISWGTALYVAVLLEVAIIAALLSSRRALSLEALRWIEAGLFFGVLLYFGYQQVQFFQTGFFSSLSLDSWMGPVISARSMSWPWAVAIISYGILIPNTARRCLIVVAAMVASFMAITLALALTAHGVPVSARVAYVLCSLTDMALAAAVAVFGAYRIATLQLAAAELKKLGPYRLIERLGAGGTGEVYLAQHALLRRPCALKLIRPEQSAAPHFLSRFEREVQAMAALTHPNTVRIYDYGLAEDGTFYYAMEYLPGLSLQQLVTRHGPLPPPRTVFLLQQVCGALREAHAVGLVHRDIKPANILACQAGGMHDVAKLLDFGLVRVHGPSQNGNTLTGLGSIAGTPAFMSPEQAAGETDIDERCDIYSLGAVAYFLLTGRPPFVEPTSVQAMAAHLTAPVVPPSQHRPGIPADLEAIVLRCLQKDRAHRFTDVQALEESLQSTQCAADWSSHSAAAWWQETAQQPRSATAQV
jgi:serine/threonine-protein kinase